MKKIFVLLLAACALFVCRPDVRAREPDYAPLVRALDNFFREQGNGLAIYYRNLDAGFVYMFNPDQVFFGASLSKSNHALYVYALAERGLLNIHALHTYTYADRWGGTGIVQRMPSGTQFTTRELLGHSIRDSDNSTYRMLVRYTEAAPLSFEDFVREIGANTQFVRNVISQNTSARDAGLWMGAIWRYINSDARYAHYLLHDLMNTAASSHPSFTRTSGEFGYGPRVSLVMMQPGHEMARKYGWARNAFHEAAIVFAPSPYIIVILSRCDADGHERFYEISRFVDALNYEWFTVPLLTERLQNEMLTDPGRFCVITTH